MIKEEYDYQDIRDYLFNNIDLIIAGVPTNEERAAFMLSSWKEKEKAHLQISLEGINEVNIFYFNASLKEYESFNKIDITIGLPNILKRLSIAQKNILLDLSSLDHVLIMVLIKQMIKRITPKSLFATYIRPKRYLPLHKAEGLLLSDTIRGVKAVPGFVKRENDDQVLCSFVGFEGNRFKAVLESVNNVNKIIPIFAFPSGALQWFKTTMWNSMNILESETREFTIRKCLSESIFDAVEILKELLTQTNNIVLAPLGTRPHSAASAIFATKHHNTRIIYDYAIERPERTEGISYICVYHLSAFIET